MFLITEMNIDSFELVNIRNVYERFYPVLQLFYTLSNYLNNQLNSN